MPELQTVEVPTSLRVEQGTRASFGLRIATMGDGGEFRIPVHVLSGHAVGPRLVVMSTAHGYEIDQISVLMELYQHTDLGELSGELVLVPVANPAAFEMGSRNTWLDGLWGDSGNMNRLWPGRPNGWLTERFCYALSSLIGSRTEAVIDMHASGPTRALAYGYVAPGNPGDRGYELTLAFGHTILIRQTAKELDEKQQSTGTSSSWLRSVGILSYSCEIGPFFGLEDDRPHLAGQSVIDVPQVGVRGVINVMKLLGMLPGKPEGPSRRVIVQPELNLRPDNGGLLISEFDHTAVGRIVPKGALLGTVVSPYTFEVMDMMEAPFDSTLILAATYRLPYSKVNPGDIGYIVADWSLTEEVEWSAPPAWPLQ